MIENLAVYAIILAIIFLLTIPKKKTKAVNKYEDTTLEVVNGKFIMIDKKRFNA